MLTRRLCLIAVLGACATLVNTPAQASARTLLSAQTAPSARTAHSLTTTSTRGLSRVLTANLTDAGGNSSALVVDTTTGRTLFSKNPTTARLPASVEKLFTTSTALFDFGSAYRFQTDLYGVGTLSNGVFTGDLYLKGGGDPTFGDSAFDAANDGSSVGAKVQALLHNLHSAGVDEIEGAIFGDATIFDNLAGGPATGYKANLETEGELSGLSYDDGFTDGSETALQPRPALWAAQALVSVAPSQGIKIAKGTRVSVGATPAGAALLAHVSSPTLTTLIQLTNTPSNDFFAETLNKDIGHFFGKGGSTAAGAAVVQQTVAAKLGLSERTNDGSGLSRYDRTTATQVVELLEEMRPSVAFFDSLAVAGVSGTMAQEMLGTTAVNNCRGKTGTLHDVANLVGFCTAANGDLLAFAFLENGLSDSTYGHETEDVMGEALAAYDGNGSGTTAPALPQPNAGGAVTATGQTTSTGQTTTTTTTTPTTPSSGGGL